MNNITPNETQQLDKSIDLIKEVAVVSFALVATWFSMISTDAVTLPWVLLVLGAAVIYILFLPYKFAVVKDDDIGKIARGRVTSTIAVGSPVWLLIAITLILNPEIVAEVVSEMGNPESQIILRLFFLIFSTAMFLTMPIYSRMWRRNLTSMIPDDERRSLIESHSSSYFGLIATSMLVLDSALLVAAGWHTQSNLSVSHDYFTKAIMIMGFLLFFGLFSAWHMMERCNNEAIGIILEGTIVLLAFAALDYDVSVAVFLLFGATVILGIESRKKVTIEELDKRKRESDNSVSSQVFDRFNKRYPALLKVLGGLLLVSLLIVYVLAFFEASATIPVSLIVIVPFLMLLLIPMVWAYWTGNIPKKTTK